LNLRLRIVNANKQKWLLEPATGVREVRTLKDEIVKLKRDGIRKDRALAEAAALLILQKKFRALWEDEA